MRSIFSWFVFGILSVFILMMLFGCRSTSNENKLEHDASIKANFKKVAIADLKLILEYFDGVVCHETFSVNHEINECYKAYFKNLEIEAERGLLSTQINKEELSTFLRKIDSKTFNSIWHGSLSSDTLQINAQSGYVYFLKSLGKNNSTIREYTAQLINWGDISPAMIAFIINNSDQLDVTNECHRLFLAIHYMTITKS